MNFDIELILWEDCECDSDAWVDVDKVLEHATKIRTMQTVGFVVFESKNKVVLVSGLDPNGHYGGVWYIPKRQIIYRDVIISKD